MLLEIYAIVVLVYWMGLSYYLIINGKKIDHLSSLKITPYQSPSVAIIIAVRNEEAALKNALISVCNLDYSNFKLIVINDRSTDNTGNILKAVQKDFPVDVINIEMLPPGWLGKNHALFAGFTRSAEEYMLFTDADVVFKKDVLAKAMHFVVKNDLDHLTILPEITTRSSLVKSVLSTFIILLTAMQRPWAAKISSSKASIGVGAFNLVKRKKYMEAGTHKTIAMRPDDDLQLAALMKAAAGKTDVLYGLNMIEVEWYKSVKEFINGLMKNAFSGFDYNLIKLIIGVLGVLLVFVLPFPVILLFGNMAQKIMLAFTLASQLILFWKMPGSKGQWWFGFTLIYSGIILVYIFIKAAFTNIRDGGIYWRETFYSLKELRKAKKQ